MSGQRRRPSLKGRPSDSRRTLRGGADDATGGLGGLGLGMGLGGSEAKDDVGRPNIGSRDSLVKQGRYLRTRRGTIDTSGDRAKYLRMAANGEFESIESLINGVPDEDGGTTRRLFAVGDVVEYASAKFGEFCIGRVAVMNDNATYDVAVLDENKATAIEEGSKAAVEGIAEHLDGVLEKSINIDRLHVPDVLVGDLVLVDGSKLCVVKSNETTAPIGSDGAPVGGNSGDGATTIEQGSFDASPSGDVEAKETLRGTKNTWRGRVLAVRRGGSFDVAFSDDEVPPTLITARDAETFGARYSGPIVIERDLARAAVQKAPDRCHTYTRRI